MGDIKKKLKRKTIQTTRAIKRHGRESNPEALACKGFILSIALRQQT